MCIRDSIHPGRIEEVVAKAEKQIEKEVVMAGEDAAREVGAVSYTHLTLPTSDLV